MSSDNLIFFVRWSNSGKYLASAGDDQRIILWTKSAYGGGAVFGGGGKINHESYKVAHTLRIHDGDVLDIAWSPGIKFNKEFYKDKI